MSSVPSKVHRPFPSHVAVVVATILVCLAAAGPLRAQTIDACYVPDVGALYLVGLPGLPTGCLSNEHQAISWSAGGTLADGSVTAVKLADGAVITVKLADGAVTVAKLGFDPATQAELDTHAGSADHDARYFTEAELSTTGTINAGSNPVEWTRLKGVPAGLADGVDDGGSYTGSGAIVLTGNDFHLTEVCTAGELLKWDGSSWTCQADLDSGGTVTSVESGAGLTGGPITTTGTLSVDFAGPGVAATAARSDHAHEVGGANTAVGQTAFVTAGGSFNTALGASTLYDNSSGTGNTAVGAIAMISTTTGVNNTAVGYGALDANLTGGANTAIGMGALGANTAGNSNTALGIGALQNLDGGDYNIAIGYIAANQLTTGSNNIYIGSQGTDESSAIRIGDPNTHTTAYMAGISGATASSGDQVFVSSNGQLGTLTSSIRFKEDVADLGDVSRQLLELRPVQFRYRPEYDDDSRQIQYGLIAEEVERVFPELVVYGEDGRPRTVRYHLLSALLLNELQRQEAELAELRDLKEEVEALRAAVEELGAEADGRRNR